MSAEPAIRVARLGFTPLKSARHLSHPEIQLSRTGPVGDRLFCLIDPARGAVLRTAAHPALTAVVARWNGRGLQVDFPGGQSVGGVPGLPAERSPLVADYWGRRTELDVVDGPWGDAFSDYLGTRVALARITRPGSVVYGDPVTLIGSSSLRDLADRVDEGPDRLAARFRATAVLDTEDLPANAELDWSGRLRVGGAVLEITGPVPRCVVTNSDPETGDRNRSVLTALTSRTGGEPAFGIQAVVRTPGLVRIGSPVGNHNNQALDGQILADGGSGRR